MELIPSLCVTIGHVQYYCQLSTNCQILGYSQAIASQAAYYGIDTIPLNDDRTSPILLSIVNKLSGSPIYAVHHNTSSCLWAGYNMAKRFQSQSFTIFNCLHYIRFLETHNGSQIRPLSVSWTQYNQEIPIPGLNVVSCLQDNRFSETCNASQAIQIFTPKRNINRCISSTCIATSTGDSKHCASIPSHPMS